MPIPRFLSQPAFSIFSIIFAVLNRGIFSYFTSSIGKDKRLHITMAENLLNGKGLGATKYYLNDVYKPVFDLSQPFPPGYSLLVSPFLKLFNNDEYMAATTLDVLIAVVFVLVIRWVCKTIGLNTPATNLVTIIAGCFQYTFFLYSTPTDALCLTLLFAGIGQAINMSKLDAVSINARHIILTGCLFFLPGFFRYISVPIGLLLSLLLLATAYVKKDKTFIRKSFLIFLVVSVFTISLFLFLYFYSGSTPPTYYTQKGFYPRNLIHWYPFIPASFINLDFAAQRVAQIASIHYSNAFTWFEILNVVLLLILFILLFIWYRRRKSIYPATAFGLFIHFGTIVSLLTMLLLAFLAVRWAPKEGPYSWTFVMEERYFSPIYIFLQIAVIGWIVGTGIRKIRGWIKAIVLLAILVLSVEIAHGIYYNAKIVLFYEAMKAKHNYQSDYLYLSSLISKLETQFPNQEIIVASADKVYAQLAIKSGHVGIFDIENIGKFPIKVRQKSLLVLPVSQWDYWMMKDYIQVHNPKLMATVSGTRFYLLELNP